MKLLKLAVGIKILKLVDLKPDVPDSFLQLTDLEYRRIGERSLTLDIYRLRTMENSAPCLIFIHGGAWKGGNKSDYLVYLLHFARLGYVTATISYRFSQEAIFPAAVQDVKCAVRWLRVHADEYLIDSNRFAVIGGSAGGHLAMMVGYSSDDPSLNEECDEKIESSRVQAVVNIYGPYDLTTDFAIQQSVLARFIGKTFEQAPEIYVRASPKTYISPDDPPTLIFHGTRDETVPVSQSDSLQAHLNRLGIPNEYHRLDGWPHTMDAAVPVNRYVRYHIHRFLQTHLSVARNK